MSTAVEGPAVSRSQLSIELSLRNKLEFNCAEIRLAQSGMGMMGQLNVTKIFWWVALGLCVTGLALWMVTTPLVPRSPVFYALFVAIFAISPIGTFWMLYAATRYEKHPLPLILPAFIPYASLWYYFDRFHSVKHARKKPKA